MSELKFHPDVKNEIKASYQWYQKQANGLGTDFLNELESAYDSIVELPNTWPKFENILRRFLLSKFPFSVIYHFSGKTIFIVAVMHNNREPDYWKQRI